jgi:hypothetical protein
MANGGWAGGTLGADDEDVCFSGKADLGQGRLKVGL